MSFSISIIISFITFPLFTSLPFYFFTLLSIYVFTSLPFYSFTFFLFHRRQPRHHLYHRSLIE